MISRHFKYYCNLLCMMGNKEKATVSLEMSKITIQNSMSLVSAYQLFTICKIQVACHDERKKVVKTGLPVFYFKVSIIVLF